MILRLEQLEDRRLLAASLTFGAMGDSLTAPYAGTGHGSAGDRCWVEQFQALKPRQLDIFNKAVGGATSTSLLSQGQHTAVANLVASGTVHAATLIIGANDVSANLGAIFAGNYNNFVATVTANIETALNTVAAAGPVRLVVANIPDIGVTPYFRADITNDPALLQKVTDATAQANQQIEAFAAAQRIPVVDLFGLSHATLNPIMIGGVEVTNLYSPDGYHPSTVGQGILANTILEALRVGDGSHVARERLTDQQILDEAGIQHPPGTSYFDVSPFVKFQPSAGVGPWENGAPNAIPVGLPGNWTAPPAGIGQGTAALSVDTLFGAQPMAGVREASPLARAFVPAGADDAAFGWDGLGSN